jgi:hypothetical protein
MAGGCEELAMKFAYQVYPLLREYYKDGILREKDAKLALKIEDRSINIKEPEAASQVYRTIIDWCSQASGVASPSSQETEETVGAQSTAPVEQNET